LALLASGLMGIFAAMGFCVAIWGPAVIKTSLNGYTPDRNYFAFLTMPVLMAPGMIIGFAGGLSLIVFPIYARYGLRPLGKQSEGETAFLLAYAKMLVKLANKPDKTDATEKIESQQPVVNQVNNIIDPKTISLKYKIISKVIWYLYITFLVYIVMAVFFWSIAGTLSLQGIAQPDQMLINELPILKIFDTSYGKKFSNLSPFLILIGGFGYYLYVINLFKFNTLKQSK
jgi:hypothetical protein